MALSNRDFDVDCVMLLCRPETLVLTELYDCWLETLMLTGLCDLLAKDFSVDWVMWLCRLETFLLTELCGSVRLSVGWLSIFGGSYNPL